MRISKTKISRRAERKNPLLREAVLKMKKINPEIAAFLSKPRSQQIKLNLDQVDGAAKENETVIIPGKVLGKGKITKKISVSAFSFSESALKKLKESKTKIIPLEDVRGRIIK